MIKYLVGISLVAGLLLVACNKSTIVGSEILADDFIDVEYTDTTTLKMINVIADSSKVYPVNSSMFLLGSIDDPIFGKTKTEVYYQIRKLFDIPDMTDVVLDSVVLSLSVNPTGFWGDTLAEHTINVYEIGESLSDVDSIYSNTRLDKGDLLATKSISPVNTDSAAILVNGDTLYLNNVLRVQLDPSYGEKLLADTMALQNDTLIQELTNGLLLESSTTTSSVFGVNTSVFLDDYNNKVILYFNRGDSVNLQLPLTLGGKRGMYIEHERSGSILENYLNNQEGSDTLLFLSGLQNNNIWLELPSLEDFSDLLINYAEIEFHMATTFGGLPFEPVEQVHLYNENDDGSLRYIDDLNISILQNTISYYDGLLMEEETEDGITVQKYNINFTNELKRRITEEDVDTRILITPAVSNYRAYRSYLYGPESTVLPAKLKITYTKQ